MDQYLFGRLCRYIWGRNLELAAKCLGITLHDLNAYELGRVDIPDTIQMALIEYFETNFIPRITEGLGLFGSLMHLNAKSKGWWDNSPNFAEKIANCHSELSEALDAEAKSKKESEKIPPFKATAEELGDAIIRILDLGEAARLNVAEAMAAKYLFNKTRSYRHGNKKF